MLSVLKALIDDMWGKKDKESVRRGKKWSAPFTTLGERGGGVVSQVCFRMLPSSKSILSHCFSTIL